MKKYIIFGLVILGLLYFYLKIIRKKPLNIINGNWQTYRLSKNFVLGEFAKVEPTKEQFQNMKHVVNTVIQPLRDYLGVPIIPTSGIRTPEKNTDIGGAKNSQHLNGEAVDFVIKGVSNETILEILRQMKYPVDQVIDEQVYKDGKLKKWMHVSAKKSNNRFVFLRARNKAPNGEIIYTYA